MVYGWFRERVKTASERAFQRTKNKAAHSCSTTSAVRTLEHRLSRKNYGVQTKHGLPTPCTTAHRHAFFIFQFFYFIFCCIKLDYNRLFRVSALPTRVFFGTLGLLSTKYLQHIPNIYKSIVRRLNLYRLFNRRAVKENRPLFMTYREYGRHISSFFGTQSIPLDRPLLRKKNPLKFKADVCGPK